MKKAGPNAKWNELSAEQCGLLEEWLFEDRLGFEIALERAQLELGFEGSMSSLKRFYARTAEERMLRSLVSAPEQVRAINDTEVSAEELRAAGMKVVARLFLQRVVQSPGETKEWSGLAKLLLQSQAIEQRSALKREDQELKRRALAFAREKFQYDAMEAGVKALPQLQALAERNLSGFERNQRQNALRRHMWGPNIPEPLPESQEEAEAMARQFVL
ncbi:MAG TPA: hypothetical protein VFC07_07555, partial [Verrucomicrobiae bacterium]|nr:hypothetical protein [Verrucomicrobiae bacterium]